MKNMPAYAILISGICLTTFGHYADFWALGYPFAAGFALLYLVMADEE